MASEIEGKVKEIVCEQLGVAEEEVSLGASFIEDLGADNIIVQATHQLTCVGVREKAQGHAL